MAEESSQLVVESQPIGETDSSGTILGELQKSNLSHLDADSDYKSLRKEIKYARNTVKRLEKLDKVKAKKIARKAGLASGVKRDNGWLQGLKQWNVGRSHYSIPKRGTPEHDEVMALVKQLVPKAKEEDVVAVKVSKKRKAAPVEESQEVVAPKPKRVKKAKKE